jgi:hypothetical protein
MFVMEKHGKDLHQCDVLRFEMRGIGMHGYGERCVHASA